jgi:hypothetical protein
LPKRIRHTSLLAERNTRWGEILGAVQGVFYR